MPRIFILIFLTSLILSCNRRNSYIDDRLRISEKFLECLKNNTPNKILEYTEQGITDRIDEKESRDFNVNKAHKFIEKFGIPSKDNWIIKDDPENNLFQLVITIPIFKGYDSAFNLLQADIILSFPPSQFGTKITSYEIADKYVLKATTPLPNVQIDTTL